MNILCVDDESLVLDLTMSMCRELSEDYEVYGFERAKPALDWMQDNKAEIAILDINLPDHDGLELAAKIKEISPDTAIIFLTGYEEYAVDAFKLHASGYLLKPVSSERLAEEINYALSDKQDRKMTSHIVVQTFGEFDVFVDGELVTFPRARAKELLAYLVDRQGGSVTRANAFAALWEDAQYDRSMQKQLDVVIRTLRQTLEKYGIDEIFEMKKGLLRVVPENIDCDLYRFYEGDADIVNVYRGEYMSGYSWASMTEAYMDRKRG